MTSRRVFLSGSAASLLAVPALPFAQQALSIAPQSPPPLARELKRQLQRAVKAIADQGRGEGARRVAVVLRLWAAHGVVQGYDAQMRDGLARAIKRRGRDAFLYGQAPHEKMRQEQQAFGIPERLLPGHPPLNPELREKNLDLLLKEGITPSLLRTADWFDAISVRMDRQFTQPIRDDYTTCDEMRGYKEALCDAAEAVCYFAVLFPNPGTADACAVMMGACLGAQLAYWGICGWRGR